MWPDRPPNGQVKVSGLIERLVFENQETMFTVAVLTTDQGPLTVVGPLGSLAPGQPITVWGRLENHPNHGRQLTVERYRLEQPQDGPGLEAYLGSGLIPGIGPKTAKLLVERFGRDVLDIIENQPQRLREIPGIGKKKLAKIIESVGRRREMAGLAVFLTSHGLSTGLAVKLHDRFGQAALAKVRANPYLLVREVQGIGFGRADELARKLGLAVDSPERIEAGLNHCLQAASDEGHLFLTRDRLIRLAADLLGVKPGLVGPVLDDLAARKRLKLETGFDRAGGEAPIYLPGLYLAEKTVADRLGALLRGPGAAEPQRAADLAASVEAAQGLDLAPAQRQALINCLTGPVTVITGGPGTGKTTIIKALTRMFFKLGLSLALAAPTGRAAKRLSEATGQPASTIHRLLGYTPQGGFGMNAANRLEFKVVIVDEASMIDIGLMAHLLLALADDAVLVLVGDVDQLPPVGPGQVLADIIASRTAGVVELTDIFRQAAQSRIVTNAHLVRKGEMPRLENAADFYFIDQPDPHRAARLIVEMAARRIPDRFGLDPLSEVQVLAPMRRGLAGVEGLNLELQQALNPAGQWLAGERFRVGDKVLQLKNNYDKMIFNGDVGRVTAPLANGGALVEFDGQAVPYERRELDQLALAYCMSIHKSQGSEYRAVVVPVLREHWIMLGRNLIYTALTRARDLAIIVGGKDALKRAVGHVGRTERAGLLRQRLGEGNQRS